MNPYHRMFEKTRTSPRYDQFLKLVNPLKDHFGINHFWYYRITKTGLYSYIGMHTQWDEFCFGDSSVAEMQERIRTLTNLNGLQLMQTLASDSEAIREIFDMAWHKFKIRFSLNFGKETAVGIEGYGFASYFSDYKADERLLNQLPLLQYFAQNLRAKNRKIFELLDDNQVDLFSLYGMDFMARPDAVRFPRDKTQLLYQLELGSVLELSSFELEVFRFLRYGYPARYIAKQLRKSVRTIENYMAVIKEKLGCHSKVQLIQKAQEIDSIGYFNA